MLETSAARLENNKVEVSVTVDAKAVDKAIAATYKDLAKKYRFPGFRPGHAPRPVVDSLLGRDNVLAQATETLVNDVEPSVRNAEDIVPVGDPDFPDPKSVEAGKPFAFKVVYGVRPELKLSSFEPVSITLPSEEATEAEIDAQVETFRGYFGKYEDIEGRAVEAGDSVYLKAKGDENVPSVDFENRLYKLGSGSMPEAFDEGLVGMKPGEEKAISFELPQPAAKEGEEAPEAKTATVQVTLNRLVQRVLPEVTDEFAKNNFGFDGVQAMRDAIAKEIGDRKKQSLPQLKENSVTRELAKRLEGEPTPEYVQTVFQELGQNFLSQLQSAGTNLDNWLKANNLSSQQFMADLNHQASDIAHESLALDALVAEKGFDCTDEDVDEEFKKAGVKDWKATKKEFEKDGRIPAIRVSVRRNKAIDWLLETADVTVSDEPPAEEAPAEKAEEKPAKKAPAKKKAAKKAEPAAEAQATVEGEEKPAPKKRAPRKTAAKKAEEAAEGDAPTQEAADKPAPKKRATKKSTAKKDEAGEAEKAE